MNEMKVLRLALHQSGYRTKLVIERRYVAEYLSEYEVRVTLSAADETIELIHRGSLEGAVADVIKDLALVLDPPPPVLVVG